MMKRGASLGEETEMLQTESKILTRSIPSVKLLIMILELKCVMLQCSMSPIRI